MSPLKSFMASVKSTSVRCVRPPSTNTMSSTMVCTAPIVPSRRASAVSRLPSRVKEKTVEAGSPVVCPRAMSKAPAMPLRVAVTLWMSSGRPWVTSSSSCSSRTRCFIAAVSG